ncbi:hypothetical protein GGI35DRAFT_426524 [Trichoderma velutinum]
MGVFLLLHILLAGMSNNMVFSTKRRRGSGIISCLIRHLVFSFRVDEDGHDEMRAGDDLWLRLTLIQANMETASVSAPMIYVPLNVCLFRM